MPSTSASSAKRGELKPVTPEQETGAAWDVIHDALPPGWRVGPVDPGVRQWRVVALSPQPGRRKPPATISGQGVDELAALRDLAERLSERRAVRP